jgi:hypothetical protein
VTRVFIFLVVLGFGENGGLRPLLEFYFGFFFFLGFLEGKKIRVLGVLDCM